jgi:hypothetical protein
MSTSFEKFKKENLIKAIIISAVLGVFCSLFVAGLVLLILKLCVINISWLYYCLIGVVVAAVVGGGMFLLLKPNDKKLAKKLDKDYNLNEHVQTMVEYSGKDGDMVVLQREQTTEILNNVQKKKPSIFAITKLAVLPVLACAVFFTAVFIPAKGEEGGSYTPPTDQTQTQNKFTLSAWQKTALNQLIDDVNGSELGDSVKSGIVSVLQNLLSTLEKIDTKDKMEEAVTASVSLIDGIISSVNTYAPISEELKTYENVNVKELGNGLYNCVQVYKQSTKYTTISIVNSKAEELDTLILDELTKSIDLVKADVNDVPLANWTEIRKYIETYRSDLETALTNISKDNENYLSDDIYIVCKQLYDNLGFDQTGYSRAALKVQINEYLDIFLENMSEVTYSQAYNSMMRNFILQVLSDIFEIDVTEKYEETPKDEDDMSGSEGGGFGNGDTHYGDDSMEIYYPDENMRVKYGQVINEYYNKVTELVANGDASDELQKYISEFFSILFTGLDDDINN